MRRSSIWGGTSVQPAEQLTPQANKIMSSAQTPGGAPAGLTPWEIVKALLIADIQEGKVPPTMSPKVVYSMRVEYRRQVEYRQFRTNLNNLRKSLKAVNDRAIVDRAAVAHDQQRRLVHQNITLAASSSHHRWDASEAQRLLKLDVNNEMHRTMAPKELRMTRCEYKAFPLNVFRKHIHQEVRSRKETAYWQVRRRQGKNDQQLQAAIGGHAKNDDSQVAQEATSPS
jgi:hypothetical protein